MGLGGQDWMIMKGKNIFCELMLVVTETNRDIVFLMAFQSFNSIELRTLITEIST